MTTEEKNAALSSILNRAEQEINESISDMLCFKPADLAGSIALYHFAAAIKALSETVVLCRKGFISESRCRVRDLFGLFVNIKWLLSVGDKDGMQDFLAGHSQSSASSINPEKAWTGENLEKMASDIGYEHQYRDVFLASLNLQDRSDGSDEQHSELISSALDLFTSIRALARDAFEVKP